MIWRFACVILAALAVSCAPSKPVKTEVPPPPPVYEGGFRGVAGTVAFLASDELEGRGIGTAGLEKAAAYIHQCFDNFGLQPLEGLQDQGGRFYQSFPYKQATGYEPGCTLAGGGASGVLNKTFRPISISGDGTFNAPIVFAGFGASRPQQHYDDYADIDVRGKAVLVLRYEPRDKSGKSLFTRADTWSDSAALQTKARVAQEKGAVAMLLVEPANQLVSFQRGMGEDIRIPVISVTPTLANQWLTRGAVREVKALRDSIEADGRPASAELADVRVSGAVKLTRRTDWLRNVAAVLPGQGPGADEYIVIGAHYDHLGYGRGVNKTVHNGADDNASGTAALLEIARRLVARAEKPKRSIIFIAFTGEEERVLGSSYFVRNPPVPLEKIVAMVNLDMVGRVRAGTILVGGGGTAAAFKDILKQVDDQSPLMFKSSGDGGWGPSDHMTFALKKIPVLFFFSGIHTDYHTPTDDADKINYAGIEQVIAAGEDLIDRLVVMPKQAYDGSHDGKDPHGGAYMGEAPRVTLGVVPDYNADDDVIGVRIAGSRADSPAHKAGLIEGDVIVRLGETNIESIYGLTAALAAAQPDKPTTVTILRDGQRLELPVTLTKRK